MRQNRCSQSALYAKVRDQKEVSRYVAKLAGRDRVLSDVRWKGSHANRAHEFMAWLGRVGSGGWQHVTDETREGKDI